jgi:hypothetical protein
MLGWEKIGDFNKAPLSRTNGTYSKYSIFGKSLEKFGKPIEKFKIENLVTLLQLRPPVGFLAMAGKIQSSRENIP